MTIDKAYHAGSAGTIAMVTIQHSADINKDAANDKHVVEIWGWQLDVSAMTINVILHLLLFQHLNKSNLNEMQTRCLEISRFAFVGFD